MSLPDFPTLNTSGRTQLPDQMGFHKGHLIDPTLRSDAQDGLPLARQVESAIPLEWQFEYRDLPDGDLDLLLAFEVTVSFGADAFHWVDPVSGTSYAVKFLDKIDAQLEEGTPNLWRVPIHIYQALGVAVT